MRSIRKICLVTGSRAEYGLLRWLARDIADDDRLCLQLLVTGAHLAPRFGDTWREIEADGFAIDARVPMLEDDDSALAVARSTGRGVAAIAEALARLAPDIAVILGDRFEMLAAASSALILRIPIAHIHGGERTEGAFDEAIRHAITKMSFLHFAAAEPYARRVIQLGEDPACVFCVGAPGLDALERARIPDRAALEASLGVALHDPLLLVTYHPATRSAVNAGEGVRALLAALDDFPRATVIVTGVNADTGHAEVAREIARFAAARSDRVLSVTSLGHERYLGAMRIAAAVVGNSSSGLVEAPAVGTPTVNVGDRQKGRLRAASVIDCAERREAIGNAIRRALAPEFRARIATQRPPYGGPGASRRIKDVLATASLSGALQKTFHDLAAPA